MRVRKFDLMEDNVLRSIKKKEIERQKEDAKRRKEAEERKERIAQGLDKVAEVQEE